MNRWAYGLYVLRRLGEAGAIALAAGALVRWLEVTGWIRQPALQTAASAAMGWIYPALGAAAAHVALGPKQRRPVFRRVPGALYVYAGVAVSRSAGCRGGYTVGATGSGKTTSCIYPRLHSLCVNQPGRPAGRHGPAEPPWGGLVCGEKGNEWQAMEALFAAHGRRADLRVLRTEAAGVRPAQRLNLLACRWIPADTYAGLIIDAGLAVEGTDSPDEFFVPQARDKIAWGLRFLRGAEETLGGQGGGGPVVSLSRLFELLTSIDGYRAAVGSIAWELAAPGGELERAREHLERHHWNQPPDQLGGLLSTLENFLGPYAEPSVAALVCGESTVSVNDLEQGVVLCLALPQALALQRRYVTALLKGLVYQVIRARFDAPAAGRNVILIEQDEWQRYAIRADCDVDLIREAQGTTCTASQSQDAVWARFRSREQASPLIANLRNRWICQAATDACAEESVRLLGETVESSVSVTRGESGRSRTVARREAPVIPKARLRHLAPFEVIFAPAEGRGLYKHVVAMPVTPSGEIPPWWFGDWNPLHALAALWGPARPPWCFPSVRADTYVPPWRAQAPWRARLVWLLGLDGTHLVLSKMSRKQAARGLRRPP